jgi:hypothetical protein
MERLIAERIAARQRDMDEITERMKASMPSSAAEQQQQHSLKEYDPNDFITDMPIPPVPPVASFPSEETRKVRFQEDTDSIFMKLKRKVDK